MTAVDVRTETLSYAQAANLALRHALRDRPETILFGEDIALPGGVFGVTKGLRDEFGDRVFDTPISESAIIGAAIGAAMMGRRPIIEIMFIDFTLVALDQIVNQAANVRYVSNGRLTAPLTIRTQQGATPGSCAQHSQNLEALFAHIPGLLVGVPSTPADAYEMLTAAIDADDPALVIESRGLYHGTKEPVPTGGPATVGGARVRRSGDAATLVSWGPMCLRVLEAADTLAAEGIEVEVIDARWLAPFDEATVLGSVARTSRLAIVHEANVTAGFGAEIAARVAERGLHSLDAPILRIGVPDVRMPAAPHLQAALIPSADVIVERVRRLTEL